MEMANKISVKIVKAVVQDDLGPVQASAIALGLAKATCFLIEVMRHRGFDASPVYEEGMEVFGEVTQSDEFRQLVTDYDEKQGEGGTQ